MTAADHLAKAEQLIDASLEQAEAGFIYEERNLLLRAISHLLAAIGLEMGVPPSAAAQAGASSG